MPTIKKILGDDQSRHGDEAVGYEEGNFILYTDYTYRRYIGVSVRLVQDY